MGYLSKLVKVFIPNKTMSEVTQPGYGTDMRAIENMFNILLAKAIQEITSTGATVTITNPFGPVVNLEVAGGGGGGITDLLSPLSSITITNPTGPTTDIDVKGPFQNSNPYGDGTSVGVGRGVLNSITTGGSCTAVGNSALTAATTGSNNTAIGHNALPALTGANGGNTAVGSLAMQTATGGSDNTAIGNGSLQLMTTGSNNTGLGWDTLHSVTTGTQNTAIGAACGLAITTHSSNTFVGYNSGNVGTTDADNQTCLGALAKCTGAGAVAIGIDSGGGFVNAGTNEFALGNGNHIVMFRNVTTGAGSAALGANCPATTLTAPKGWIRMRDASGGTIGYIPYWQ